MDDDHEYDIAIASVSGCNHVSDASIRSAIEATLRRHGARAARISVALVDDAHIATLNESYLNHPGSTDVLSFDLRDPAEADGSNRLDVDGELVLSVQTARREAAARGNPLEAELGLYAVHGVLHLLGYDDKHESEARSMHELEDEVLSSIGIGPAYRGIGA